MSKATDWLNQYSKIRDDAPELKEGDTILATLNTKTGDIDLPKSSLTVEQMDKVSKWFDEWFRTPDGI
jgi:hypothetical protein